MLLALCLALAGAARGEDWSAWQRAYDPATRTRFIPVELWTGAPWDGTQEIRMAPAALEFGRRGDKSMTARGMPSDTTQILRSAGGVNSCRR